MADQLDCALDLMRRMPPADIEDNLANLIDLAPDLCEHLLSAVDQPLKIATDKAAHRDYLLCDYNRDGDSYRSPWSNKYDPPLGDGAVPSDGLRKFEIQANEVFDIYRDLFVFFFFPSFVFSSFISFILFLPLFFCLYFFFIIFFL